MKKNLLKNAKLYLIVDKDECKNKDPLRTFRAVINKGIGIVQLRDKTSPKIEVLKLALRFKQLAEKAGILFIVNDFADIAKIVNADGVHIGQEDLPVNSARRLLGQDKIIGVSCRNLTQLRTAKKNGADYMAIGPVFKTALKPKVKPIGKDALKKINARFLGRPVFAVGAITERNLNGLLCCGINRIAVLRAVCNAKSPARAVKTIISRLNYQ